MARRGRPGGCRPLRRRELRDPGRGVAPAVPDEADPQGPGRAAGPPHAMSGVGRVEDLRIRGLLAGWPWGFVGATDPDPVVGKQDVLSRIDARHVAVDAIASRS